MKGHIMHAYAVTPIHVKLIAGTVGRMSTTQYAK